MNNFSYIVTKNVLDNEQFTRKNLDDKYIVRCNVLGFNSNEVSVEVINNTLKISGKKEDSKNQDNVCFSSVSSFDNSYYLELDSDLENISAKMENGVLAIIIPRTKTKDNQKRTIKINT